MMNRIMPFSASKLKPNLQMAVQRMQMHNNKRGISAKKSRKEVADLLTDMKGEKARIRVETVIRDDITIEAYEVLILMCELLMQRIKQVELSKSCPEELKETISSIIWASKYVDIEEFKEIRNQLVRKYGPNFAECADNNIQNRVNHRLYDKMTYVNPGKNLVVSYLEAIAEAYKIDFDPSTLEFPLGYSGQMAPGSGLSSVYDDVRQSRISIASDVPPQASNYTGGSGGVSVNNNGSGGRNEAEMEEYKQFLRNQRNQEAHAVPVASAYSAMPAANTTAPHVIAAAAAVSPYESYDHHPPTPMQSPPSNLVFPPTPAAVSGRLPLDEGFNSKPISSFNGHTESFSATAPSSTSSSEQKPLHPANPNAPASPHAGAIFPDASAPSASHNISNNTATAAQDPLEALQARMAELQKRK